MSPGPDAKEKGDGSFQVTSLSLRPLRPRPRSPEPQSHNADDNRIHPLPNRHARPGAVVTPIPAAPSAPPAAAAAVAPAPRRAALPHELHQVRPAQRRAESLGRVAGGAAVPGARDRLGPLAPRAVLELVREAVPLALVAHAGGVDVDV